MNGVYENHKLVDNDVPDDPLAEIDVSKWLVFKRPEEDGPDIRGGHPDALIVLATKANKNGTCDALILREVKLIGCFRGITT